MTAHDIKALMGQCHDVLTMAEPAPAGQSLDGGSSRDRLPINPRLTDAKADLHNTLTSWARMVSEEKPTTIDCHDDPLSISAWLYGHADWLTTHPAVDDLHHEITTRTTEILHCVDRGDDRIFLGVHAGEEIYATKGQKTVTLPSGEVRTVSEIRDWMKHDIQNEVRPPSEVAAILRTLHGIDVTADKIRKTYENDEKRRKDGKMGRRAGLHFIRYEGRQKVFRVGDVAARLTRLKRAS